MKSYSPPRPGLHGSRALAAFLQEQREERLAVVHLASRGAVANPPVVAQDDGRLPGAGDAGVEEVPVVHEGVRICG